MKDKYGRRCNSYCPQCGNEVYKKPKEERKFCSKTCWDLSPRKPKVPTKICPVCFKSFKDTAKRSIRHRIHCSRICSNISRAGIKYKIGQPRSKVATWKMYKKLAAEKHGYICVGCGNNGFYAGKPLTLQIDHIDGNNQNHQMDNLRFLCPNCHSQTDNYAGKNIKRKA